MAMAYILDSNIFIQSRKQLPMDVWVTFWSRFAELAQRGDFVSCGKVKDEIENDDVFDWIKENTPKEFFIPLDAESMVSYAELQQWASTQDFTDSAKIEFATVADAFLIAVAKAKGLTLVTFEKSNPQRKNRVMIPDACSAIGARCCDLNTALRELGVTI